MRKFFCLTAFVAVMVALAGYGAFAAQTSIPTGSVIRQIQPGDNVVYTVTGKASMGGVPVNVTGTYTITIQSASRPPAYGNRSLDEIGKLDLSVNGNPLSISAPCQIEQAANGTIYLVGTTVGNKVRTIVSASSDPVRVPGNLHLGESDSHTIQWSDSTVVTTSWSVTDLKSVCGKMAYKVHTTRTQNGHTSSSDSWYSPDLKCAIKSTMKVVTKRGTFDLTLNLKSKNF